MVIAVTTVATTVVVLKVATTVVAEGGKQHMLCGACRAGHQGIVTDRYGTKPQLKAGCMALYGMGLNTAGS